MPYLKGMATTYDDLISQIITWATDTNIHGADAWTLMRNEPWPNGTILKAHGWSAGEEVYLGLMPAAFVQNTTYCNWFLQKEVFEEHFLFGQRGLRLPQDTKFVLDLSHSTVTVLANTYIREDHEVDGVVKYHDWELSSTRNSQSYTFLAYPEIFSGDSRAMFLGVFKQYSAGLPFNEQAGALEPKVSPKEVKYTSMYSVNRPVNWTPPPYPGVGFPALGCDYHGFADGYCNFWVVKDRHRLIIVTQDSDQWQMAQIGFLEPYHVPEEYSFPAVIVGGMSGVLPVSEPWAYPGTLCLSMENGYKFDFDPRRNVTLSHGNPTFAASYGDNTSWDNNKILSQVQLMLPDGTWQGFCNFGITTQLISSGCWGCPTIQVVHPEPVRPTSLRYVISPTNLDLSGTRHLYNTNPDDIRYQLEPVELVQACPDNNNYKVGIMGRLWRTYWPSRRVFRYGEQTFNGKLHLVVPNGYEGRKFYTPHGETHETNSVNLAAQQLRLDGLSETMDCVIRLED